MLIIFYLFMSSTSNYFEYANKSNRDLTQYEGILIYSTQHGPLPQEILFLPCKWNKKGRFEIFLVKTFSKGDKILYQVYFQGIHWIMPNIVEKLSTSKYADIKIGNSGLYKATYVLLTFDQSPDPLRDEMIIPPISTLIDLPIAVDGHQMKVKLMDLPDEIGTLKIYESIDW